MKKRSSRAKAKVATRKHRTKIKQYPAYMLGIALVTFVLLESAILSPATTQDWHAGLSMLDVSSGVTAMASDLKLALQPTMFTYQAVDDFYNQAAVASTDVLDVTNQDSDSVMAVTGINNFYQVASKEMANVLDISNYASPWQPQVAGASVSH
jgi:hypothetical protein